MLYDSTIRDAAFAEGRPPADIDQLLSWAQLQLHIGNGTRWKLISARRKMGTVLFEIEEDASSGARRLIGKFGNTGRAASLYRSLQLLRNAGFAPPSLYTVPEPVALVVEREFVLQEKVPGTQALLHLLGSVDESRSASRFAAEWLVHLHQCPVSAIVAPVKPDRIDTWANELGSILKEESARIARIARAIRCELAQPSSTCVPSHGDFHAMNLFIHDRKRVSGIDIDKFGAREPESDLGCFLAQTASHGYFARGSFECTEAARRTFLEQYEARVRQPIIAGRLGMHIAMTFLKNLHFELVLLKTGRSEFAEPWLSAAAGAILEGNIHLRP
jgi:hypothetical protein